MTNETRQNLFKGAAALAAFGFAATGHDTASPLMAALVGMAGSVTSQFGVDV